MRKRIAFIMVTACFLLITGCGDSNSSENPAGTDSQMVENAEQTDTEENIATESVADYPAVIMVNDAIYLLEGDPMPTEVDESAIIGYTESYTDTFPENNGETNFNRELGMPYAQVEGGIAVLYKNEWYLCTPVLSPLDGVTMEVTECSDISVTVKITNDTDKDIECGDHFYLEIQNEETGEWREVDTVIDDAAFNAIAYMIQKDSPYEMVINFEWLYGKLKPGRYRIVKTIMDFRGTGDYTNYTLKAEFSIAESSLGGA